MRLIGLIILLAIMLCINVENSFSQNAEEVLKSDDTISEGLDYIKKARDQSKNIESGEGEDAESMDQVEKEYPENDNEQDAEAQTGYNLSRDNEPLYTSQGRRDPFKPFIKEVETDSEHGVDILLPPIKKYSLDEFKLVGVILVNKETKAMVVDPEKNTYYLGVGDDIGNREGVIIEVRNSGILVEEKRRFEDVFGNKKIEVKNSVLAFRDEE